MPYREILSPRFLCTGLASSVRTSKPWAIFHNTALAFQPFTFTWFRNNTPLRKVSMKTRQTQQSQGRKWTQLPNSMK